MWTAKNGYNEIVAQCRTEKAAIKSVNEYLAKINKRDFPKHCEITYLYEFCNNRKVILGLSNEKFNKPKYSESTISITFSGDLTEFEFEKLFTKWAIQQRAEHLIHLWKLFFDNSFKYDMKIYSNFSMSYSEYDY